MTTNVEVIMLGMSQFIMVRMPQLTTNVAEVTTNVLSAFSYVPFFPDNMDVGNFRVPLDFLDVPFLFE